MMHRPKSHHQKTTTARPKITDGEADAQVYGMLVDSQTRCEHYHSPVDVIAIRFKCCQKYYPCYRCHEACETHPIERWSAAEFETKAVLCGVCRQELSIAQYIATTRCPHCQALFNEGCRKHHAIYFEISEEQEHECKSDSSPSTTDITPISTPLPHTSKKEEA